MPDASVHFACAGLLRTKEEIRTLRALVPAWCRSSWLTSREPREVLPRLDIFAHCEPAWLGYSRGGLASSPRNAWTLVRGQASRGGGHRASSGMASSGWLARRQRDQGGVPHEVRVTQAMTTKGTKRVPAREVSSFPLWCKGGKCSRGVPRHQAKVAILVQ